MANTFKNAVFNASLAADTDRSALATVAANTQTTLIGMTIANITSGVINVGVKFNLLTKAGYTPMSALFLVELEYCKPNLDILKESVLTYKE